MYEEGFNHDRKNVLKPKPDPRPKISHAIADDIIDILIGNVFELVEFQNLIHKIPNHVSKTSLSVFTMAKKQTIINSQLNKKKDNNDLD
jgi:hypothetical protein